MKYEVAIHPDDDGFAVSVPGLPGCWSQGDSEQEALGNIETAIREYLEVVEGLLEGSTVPGVNHLDAVRVLGKGGLPNRPAGQTHRHDGRNANHHHSPSQSGQCLHHGRNRSRCRIETR